MGMQKDLEYYMSLEYEVAFRRVLDDPNYPEGYYFGRIVELDGCNADGETLEELLEDLEISKRLYIESKLEGGYTIPEPCE